MKNLLIILLCLWQAVLYAGTYRRVEYFIDTDPGTGQAIVAPVPINDVSAFTADLSQTADGMHVLYVRLQDVQGSWSPTMSHPFLKTTLAQIPAVPITKAEYFVNTDPGYGKANSISVSESGESAVTVDLSNLSNGMHVIYLRTQDANGKWSLTMNHPLLKTALAQAETPSPVIKAEYFVDNDPGFGKAAGVSPGVNGAFDLMVDLSPISEGMHILYTRTQNSAGIWSTTMSYPFLRTAVPQNELPAPAMKAEYFIDADPGIGHANTVTATANGELGFTVELANVSNGLHVLYMRTMDAYGNWSQTMSRTFFRTQIADNSKANINSAEYYIDTDPGYGKATVIPISNPADNLNIDLVAELPVLAIGKHTLYVRAKDADGQWSVVHAQDFCYGAVARFALSDSVICGERLIQFQNQSIDATATTVYAWDLDGDGTAESNASNSFSFYYDTPGRYPVSLTLTEAGGACPNTFTRTLVVSAPQLTIETALKPETYINDKVIFRANIDMNRVSKDYRISWTATGGEFDGDSVEVVYSAAAAGQYTITANLLDIAGCRGSATATIRILPLLENFIVKDAIDVFRSKKNKIETQYLASDNIVVWESLNPAIATVSSNGLVECVANGKTIIRGTVDGIFTDSIVVNVKDYIAIERLVMDESVGLEIGDKFNISATVLPRDASIQTVSWYSSDTTVATVSQSGQVTATKLGTCNIIAVAADGNIPAITIITVNAGAVKATNIVVTDTLYAKIGDIIPIRAEFVPYYTTDKSLSWLSTKTAIATVTNMGEITAIAAGETKIIASNVDGLSAICVLRVRNSAAPVLSLPSAMRFLSDQQPWSIDLNRYVADDITIDENIVWTVIGTVNLNANLSASNQLSFTAKSENWSGSELITLSATDGDGLKTLQNIDIQISVLANRAPNLYFPNITATVAAATTFALAEYVQDDQQTVADLTFEVSNTGKSLVTLLNGTLNIAPENASWTGTDTITISATDAQGLTTSQTILYTVAPLLEYTAPRIASIPVQISDATGTFQPLYLSRYVQDEYTLPDQIYWTCKQSFRVHIQIDNNIATFIPVDINWLGSERVWFFAENNAGLVDSVEIIFSKMNQTELKWEGSAQIKFFAEKTLIPKESYISLYPTLTGAQSWKWIVTGAGTTRSFQELQPRVPFTVPGMYTVALIAENSSGIDTLEFKDYITVFGISAADSVLCKGDKTTLSIATEGLDSWKWMTGEADSSIELQPDQSRYATVTVTKGLFEFKDSIYIQVNQPFLFSQNDTVLCYGSKLRLDAGQYSSYKWQDNSAEAYFDADPYQPGNYSVTVTDNNGCIWSDGVQVTAVHAIPQVYLGADTAICATTSLTLLPPAGLTYAWSTGVKSSFLNITEAGNYAITVTDANQCKNSDTIKVELLETYPEQLAALTYSESSTAIISIWQRTPGKRIKEYQLFRETGSAGNWVKVKTVPYNDSTYAIDRDADAVMQSYRYRLTTIDSLCPQPAVSAVHRSMHITRSAGLKAQEANISWSAYVGMPVNTYRVMVIANGTEKLITSIPEEPGRQQYSLVYDQHQPGNDYRVEFDLPSTIILSDMKSDSGPFSQSLSNLSEAVIVSDGQTEPSFEAKIYPVPAHEYVNISVICTSAGPYTLRILAADGKLVFSNKYDAAANTEIQVPLKGFANGLFTIELTAGSKVFSKQFTKE